MAKRWLDEGTYEIDPALRSSAYYALTMFPYPSGDLHMGHAEVFSIQDAFVRFMRMRGEIVFNPIGWDGFGLPAENAARLRKVHPRDWVYANIEEQFKSIVRLGFSFDWSTRVNTCDPEYYRWTQWIFLEFFDNDLAYRKEAPVNWCPGCQTVLANEQVIEGHCERSGDVVVQRPLTQWFFRTTKYAQQLLDDLATIDWPDQIKTMQRNWIGRSEGAQIAFETEYGEDFEIFTTRPDTIFGATYMVFAPEHPLVKKHMIGDHAYVAFMSRVETLTDIQRLAMVKSDRQQKRGIRLSFDVINPITNEKIPAYAADYVLLSYGTGAIMAVPGADQRDFDFARQEGLPIHPVVVSADDEAPLGEEMKAPWTGDGITINSGSLTGLPTREAISAAIEMVERFGVGHRTVNYRLRDWLISRQRSWGAPIPIVHCPDCGPVGVPREELPLELPDDLDFTVDGSPLAEHPTWKFVCCPTCGNPAAQRDTDTIDTFVDSSWYYLRYLTPDDEEQPWPLRLPKAPAVVDHYIGGKEHAVMHLLFARFFQKAMRDLGHTAASEPFSVLLTQGQVLFEGSAMSKTKGNLVEPAAVYETYGADVLRGMMLFASPPEDDIDWADVSPAGMVRWLKRVWRVSLLATEPHDTTRPDETTEDGIAGQALVIAVSKAVRDATTSYESHRYNTAIARMMELTSALNTAWQSGVRGSTYRHATESLLLLLAPVCPFITEELWLALGHDGSIHDESWPTFDAAVLEEDEVDVVIQVNGKRRNVIRLPRDSTQTIVVRDALADSSVIRALEGAEVTRVTFVPNRLLNLSTG